MTIDPLQSGHEATPENNPTHKRFFEEKKEAVSYFLLMDFHSGIVPIFARSNSS
jgi:hypothetical protein